MSYEPTYSSPPQEDRPTSTMAIVSLVAGITGLTIFPFLGSLVAVITGPMAKKEIQRSRGALGGEGLATAGVITGWIGVALGVIACCGAFIAFLLPMILVALGLSADEFGALFPIWLGCF
ncbi:MAG: DUF4190 domain-containing protein [Anaerolineales bacterium]|nr:DUF4190 domain-containing protein [Anaerolineales bacterium]